MRVSGNQGKWRLKWRRRFQLGFFQQQFSSVIVIHAFDSFQLQHHLPTSYVLHVAMPKSNLRKQQSSLQPVKSKARTSKSSVRENQYADILKKLQDHDQELYGLEFPERNGKTQVKGMRSQGSGGRRAMEEIGFERPLKKARVVIERRREGESVENEVEMGTGDDQHSGSEPRFGSRSSDEEYDDEDDGESLKAARLAALEAHSRALLGLPSMPTESVGMGDESEREDDEGDKNEEGEGTGEEYISDDGWGAEDGFVSDSEDEFTSMSSISHYTDFKRLVLTVVA